MNVTCNGNDNESKEQVTYLVITIDPSLSGDAIAKNIINKYSIKVKFLYRNARQFDRN